MAKAASAMPAHVDTNPWLLSTIWPTSMRKTRTGRALVTAKAIRAGLVHETVCTWQNTTKKSNRNAEAPASRTNASQYRQPAYVWDVEDANPRQWYADTLLRGRIPVAGLCSKPRVLS